MGHDGEGGRDGRHARWDEHRSGRRTRILDAAVALIEAQPVGTPVHVRQIADRAGLARPVVYRHFADRSDLDRAVHARILELLRGEIEPSLRLEGSIEQMIGRIVGSYVRWAADHPALHRVAAEERPSEDGTTELEQAVQRIGSQVVELVVAGVQLLGAPLDEPELQAIRTMTFGLVGYVFGAVRYWLSLPEQVPGADELARQLARSIWFVVDGNARERGLVLDPTLPVERLVAAAGEAADSP